MKTDDPGQQDAFAQTHPDIAPISQRHQDDIAGAWRRGNPEAVAVTLENVGGILRGALEATNETADRAFWLLVMADQHRGAMLGDLRDPLLDETHFWDFTAQLGALLAGALSVPDATPEAESYVRAALECIGNLAESLGHARDH